MLKRHVLLTSLLFTIVKIYIHDNPYNNILIIILSFIHVLGKVTCFKRICSQCYSALVGEIKQLQHVYILKKHYMPVI